MGLVERLKQRRRMNHAMRELAKPHELVDGEKIEIPGYPDWAEWLKKTAPQWPIQ